MFDKDAINLLLIAGGVIIALLSLWAQLWVSYGSHEDESTILRRRINASYGLLWIYIAISYALIGVTIFIIARFWENMPLEESFLSRSLKQFIDELGLSFLCTSFIMGFANIAESIVSIILKGLRQEDAFQPLTESTKVKRGWIITLVVLALAILTATWLGITFCKGWFYLYIVIAIIGIFLFGLTNRPEKSQS